MEGMIAIGVAGVMGLTIGFGIAKLSGKKEPAAPVVISSPDIEWWKVRETLT
jgi:hypothetical protein